MEKTLDLKYTYTEKKDTRSGFGDGLLEAGRKNPNVVGLCADLIGALNDIEHEQNFKNTNELTMFADYRVPQILR